MEFLNPIAGVLGVTTGQLVIVAVAIVVLAVAWFVIKAAMKIATKIFTVGCFTIIVAGVALYLFFVVVR